LDQEGGGGGIQEAEGIRVSPVWFEGRAENRERPEKGRDMKVTQRGFFLLKREGYSRVFFFFGSA